MESTTRKDVQLTDDESKELTDLLKPTIDRHVNPGLSHSGSGTQVLLRGTDSVGPAFCALPRSEQLR